MAKNKMEKLVVLNSDKVKQKIVDLRTADTDSSWTDIARSINKEFDIDASGANIKSIYENTMAMEIEMSGNKEKFFSDNISKVQERYDSVGESVDKYHKIVDRTIARLSEMDDDSLVENIGDVLKAGKQLDATFRMVDNQVDLVLKEQEKISVRMGKNKKEITPQEIMRKINEYRPEMLRSLERQGKIKVYDTDLLK